MSGEGTNGDGGARYGPQEPRPVRHVRAIRPVRPVSQAAEPEQRRASPRQGTSPLKRLEDEEKEQARRTESVRFGFRLSVMGLLVLCLFSVMVFRLWSLQVLHSSSARADVAASTTRDVTVSAPRGLIEARGGQVLVSDKVQAVVTLNRQVAADRPAVVARLAVVLGITVADIKADLDDDQLSPYEPVPVEVGAPATVVVYLAEHASMFPGVSVSNVAEPHYDYGDLAAQTLGYIGDINPSELKEDKGQGYVAGDEIGQAGIEASYERYLRGVEGSKELLVDADGDVVGTKSVKAAKPGDDVVLNLDVGLQEQAQKDLAAQIAYLDSTGEPVDQGAVVVEDPQDGAILAMASLPTYDPSWWVGGISTAHWNDLNEASAHDPLLNRVTAGLYTPGSTFKIATATAALNDAEYLPPYGETLTANTYISDPGYFTIPDCSSGCTFQDDESSGCGSCNIVTAIAMSDDVFFYTLGYWFYEQSKQYGPDPIQKVAAEYGLGQPTGIDLPGGNLTEESQVDSPELRVEQHKSDPSVFPYTYYGPGDAIETAFGQGETVITPLQLADAYSTFANGGTRYAPEVASEIISPDGKLVKKIKPKVMGHVHLPASTRDTMLQGFEEEVTSPIGTGYPPAQLTDYPYSELPIAGKTGTSQINPTNPNLTNALYVAFGPTSDPKYCIAVVIPNGGYGDEAAAPVAFRLFEYLIKHPVGKVTPKVPQGAG